MPSPTLNTHLAAAAKALNAELLSVRFRKSKPERGFIEWYAKARYGDSGCYLITDGSGDGGIDAIVTEGASRLVLQFKYEPSLKLKAVVANEVDAFEKLADLLRDPDREDEYKQWLTRVTPTLQSKYKALRQKAVSDPESVRFEFVTTKRANGFFSDLIDVVDIQRIAALWQLYEEGFTPPVESVELEFDDVWSTGSSKDPYRNYVGLADVRVLLDLMERDEHERLFAQNVRTDLRTRINRTIRETYEKEPETFWLGNNGVYIVCSEATLKGDTLRLIYPSIINGSQTLHALFASPKRHRCLLLVRVLEMDLRDERGLLTAIIKRTNSQNPMRPMNLAAHDPEQLNIARYLDGLAIFYERREREWRNEKKHTLHGYMSVGIKELTQWHAVTSNVAGIGTARSKVGALFLDANYRRLFSRFADDLSQRPYGELAATVFAGLLARRFIRGLKGPVRRKAAIMQLLLVKACHEAVSESKSLAERIPDLLRFRAHSDPMSKPLRSALGAVLRDALAEHRAAEIKDSSLDLSNYFKRDDTTDKALKAASSRGSRKRLLNALEESFS